MSMDVGGAKGGLKADINVTPLVDVMLVLLIIVMLIAPMLEVFSAIQKAPAGMVALAASFLLFGVGTAFAIWKRRFSG